MKIYEFEYLFELLGQKPSKRYEKLNSIRKYHPSAEMIVYKGNWYIIVPDEVLTFNDLLKSNFITKFQRNAIQNIIDDVDVLKTELRNSILETYSQYYSFAYFSLEKGKNRKLLLGRNNSEQLEAPRKANAIRNPSTYVSEGAYLLYSFLKGVYNSDNKNLDSFRYQSSNGITYLAPQFQLFEAAIAKREFLFSSINISDKNPKYIDRKYWEAAISNYKSDKKDFYRAKIKLFIEELQNVSHLKFHEKIVGPFLGSNNKEDDDALIQRSGQLINDNYLVCNALTRLSIIDKENSLLQSLELRNLKEAYTSSDGNAKEFRSRMLIYFKEELQLKAAYRTLAVELDNELNKPEFETLFGIEEDISDVKKSAILNLENEWCKSLRIKVQNSKSTGYLPSEYYDNVLNLVLYSYLDYANGYSKFNVSDLKEILSEFMNLPSSAEDITISDDLAEIGMQQEIIWEQLKDEDETYELEIPSYSMLKKLRNAVNNY